MKGIICMIANKLVKETEFLVIDFETLTPKGRSPEPIELGLQKIHGYKIDMNASVSWLIQPPEGLHVTKLDTIQTGIKESDLVGKQSIDQVMKRVNSSCMKKDYVFIAQNAKYEANILSHYTEKYQGITKTPIMDTILLAKHVLPNLPNYKLDTLARALNLTIPKDRHRALVDCILTAHVFLRLLEMQNKKKEIIYLDELLRIAEIKTKYNQPMQMDIFDFL
jgi:DNA polymerase III subunit epsilon